MKRSKALDLPEWRRDLEARLKDRDFLALPSIGDWRLYRAGGRPRALFVLPGDWRDPTDRTYVEGMLEAVEKVADGLAAARGGLLVAWRKAPGFEIRPEPTPGLLRLYGFPVGQGLVCRLEPGLPGEVSLTLPAQRQVWIEYRSSGGHAAPGARRGNTLDALRGLAEDLPVLRTDFPEMRISLTVPKGGAAANTIPAVVVARLWLEAPEPGPIEGASRALRQKALAEGRSRECEVRVRLSPVALPLATNDPLARRFRKHFDGSEVAAKSEPDGRTPLSGRASRTAAGGHQLAVRVAEELLRPAVQALARTVMESVAT